MNDLTYFGFAKAKKIFDHYNFIITDFQKQKESTSYEACSFRLNSFYIEFRTAKITPTKAGLFVTLWIRNNEKIIKPYSINNNFDFIIIYAEKNNNSCLFIFSKLTLNDNKIISNDKNVGKLAIRVYPSWEIDLNKQAAKTQDWQLNHCLEITDKNNMPSFFEVNKFFK